MGVILWDVKVFDDDSLEKYKQKLITRGEIIKVDELLLMEGAFDEEEDHILKHFIF